MEYEYMNQNKAQEMIFDACIDALNLVEAAVKRVNAEFGANWKMTEGNVGGGGESIAARIGVTNKDAK